MTTEPLTEAACRGLPWHRIPLPDQRATCATCPALEACKGAARREVANSTQSDRAEWARESAPDVWAGRTLAELAQALGALKRVPAELRYDRPKRYCKRGHDTHEVGAYVRGGQCVGCIRVRSATRSRRRAA